MLKRAKDTQRKIWVRRIWIERQEYDYLNMPIENYERSLEGLEFDIKRGAPMQYKLEKAPWWYSLYRTSKSDIKSGSKYILGAIVGAIIVELIHLFFK